MNTTVGDFIRNPDLLGTTEPLTDIQLLVLSVVAPAVREDMPLEDLVEIVQQTTENEIGAD
jgi:hypothetical protein